MFLSPLPLFVYLCERYDVVSKSHSVVDARPQEKGLRSTLAVCL